MSLLEQIRYWEDRKSTLERKLSFVVRDGRRSKATALRLQITIATNMIAKCRAAA